MSSRGLDLSRVSSLLAFLVAACGGDGAAPDGGVNGAETEPLFALTTLVWGDDGPTGYISVSRSVELDGVSLEEAREFPGYTSVGVAAGQLLVSPSAENPTIERYRITDQYDWIDSGTLSFTNEGAEEVGFYRQYMRRGHEADVDVDVTGRVVWDPVELTIVGSKLDSVLPLSQGDLDLFANLNRTQLSFTDDVLRPFSYHDQDWFRWAADTHIVVYDRETRAPKAVVSGPCPGLDSITRDEGGNTYLGTFEYSALNPLMGTGAAPCAVKLKPDNTLDPSWNGDLTPMTGGRFVVNFRYVGGGRAIGAVLHAEEYGDGFDFAALAENTDDFWATAAQFHRLWMFDLTRGAAAPVTGIDDFEFVNPGFFHATIDGRTFVFLGDGNNGSNNFNRTVVYELDDGGYATRRFEAPGSVTQWVRVR